MAAPQKTTNALVTSPSGELRLDLSLSMPKKARGGKAKPSPVPSSKGGAAVVVLSFAVLGFTLGILAGMSRAPVVGTLITGFLGIVTGAAIPILTRKGGTATLATTSFAGLGLSIISLCVGSVSGAFTGIGVREGRWDSDFVPLVNISQHAGDLPAAMISKLALVQRSLQERGVRNKDNNVIVNQFLNTKKSESDIIDLGGPPVETAAVLASTKDFQTLRSYVRGTGHVIGDFKAFAEVTDRVQSRLETLLGQLTPSDPTERDRLKTFAEEVEIARRDLQVLSVAVPSPKFVDGVIERSAECDGILSRLVQPELDVILFYAAGDDAPTVGGMAAPSGKSLATEGFGEPKETDNIF